MAGRLVGSQRASGICLGVVVKGAMETVEMRFSHKKLQGRSTERVLSRLRGHVRMNGTSSC